VKLYPENGPETVMVLKRGFARKAAAFIIPFGSEDKEMKKGDGKIVSFPPGTAHLLEHMLFESDGGSYARKFTAMGATVNAYTASDRTAVFFTTTGDIFPPLSLLFEMLDNVDFPQTLIDKEKKIVSEEIALYDDETEQAIYYDLLKSLYRENPIRDEIAGKKEDLDRIDGRILKTAFSLNYGYNSCQLVLTGDIDTDKLERFLEGWNHPDRTQMAEKPERIRKIDPRGVSCAYAEKKKDIANNQVMAGIKLDGGKMMSPIEAAIHEITNQMFLDNYLGKMSEQGLMLRQLDYIGDDFDYFPSASTNYAFAAVYTDTIDSDKAIECFRNLLGKAPYYAINRETFERQQKKMIGDFILPFDSVTGCNGLVADYLARGVDVFELMERVGKLTMDDLAVIGKSYQDKPITVVCYKNK